MVDRSPNEAKRLLRGPPHYSLGAAHRFGRLPNRKSCDRSLAGNKISTQTPYAEMQEDERLILITACSNMLGHHSLVVQELLNATPYFPPQRITGSDRRRRGHGSQNPQSSIPFKPVRVISPAKIVFREIKTTDNGYLLGKVTLVACGEPGVTLLDITRT